MGAACLWPMPMKAAVAEHAGCMVLSLNKLEHYALFRDAAAGQCQSFRPCAALPVLCTPQASTWLNHGSPAELLAGPLFLLRPHLPYRSFHLAHARVSQQNYSLSGLVGCELKAKTVGVIGTGGIGSAACHILKVGGGCCRPCLTCNPQSEMCDMVCLFALYRIVAGRRLLPAICAKPLMQAHRP